MLKNASNKMTTCIITTTYNPALFYESEYNNVMLFQQLNPQEESDPMILVSFQCASCTVLELTLLLKNMSVLEHC